MMRDFQKRPDISEQEWIDALKRAATFTRCPECGQTGTINWGRCTNCNAIFENETSEENEMDLKTAVEIVEALEYEIGQISGRYEPGDQSGLVSQAELEAEKIVAAARPHDVGGTLIVNVTPHPVTFEEGGELVTVPPSGVILNATPCETTVKHWDGVGSSAGNPAGTAEVTFVKATFKPNEQGLEDMRTLVHLNQGLRVVYAGSIIAAQAYRGNVCAMVPMKGFERVPPAEKRMNPHKFTTFDD
jgi:hypothetical protein